MSSKIRELKLGRYRIVRQIGRGSGGNVYEALDLRLDRVVAVKILQVRASSDPDADERIERFLREARAAARLSHPGIVAVYDSDIEPETGLPFIVMEFINGRSLQENLGPQQKLDFRKVVSLGAQVARALHAAHERGIIHRDVKPANLLVTPDGRVKLTDFGVARLDSSDLTTRGQFVGTPNYASPEQVEGQPVDRRADLFCLGVVLFRCATGELPFAADSLTAVSLRIARGAFRDPLELAPELPAAFHDFLRKAIARDPGRRFSSGEEMARALEAAGGAAGDETVAAASRRPRLSTPALLAAGAAFFLLVAGSVWMIVRRAGPEAAPPPPVPARGSAGARAAPSASERSVPALRIVEQGDSSLVLEHRSHLADETLTAEVDGQEVLRRRVLVTGGIFQKIGGKRFRWTVPVASGAHSVRIRIAGKSMTTQAESTIEGKFSPGRSARLRISVNPYRDTLSLSWE